MKSTGGKVRGRPPIRKQKNSPASSENENNRSILEFFSPPRTPNTSLNNKRNDKSSGSTPRRRKNPLENLQSNLSPKYIGFSTPTSADKRRTRYRTAKLNDSDGSSSYIQSSHALIGRVRRTTINGRVISPKSSPEVSTRRNDLYESPIEKLLRKNGAMKSLPTSPCHGIAQLSIRAADVIEVEKPEEVQSKKKNCVVRLEQMNHDLVSVCNSLINNKEFEPMFDASRTEHDTLIKDKEVEPLFDASNTERQTIPVINSLDEGEEFVEVITIDDDDDDVMPPAEEVHIQTPSVPSMEIVTLIKVVGNQNEPVLEDDATPIEDVGDSIITNGEDDIEMQEVGSIQKDASIKVTPTVAPPRVEEETQTKNIEETQTKNIEETQTKKMEETQTKKIEETQTKKLEETQTKKIEVTTSIEKDNVICIEDGDTEPSSKDQEIGDGSALKDDDTTMIVEEVIQIEDQGKQLFEDSIEDEILAPRDESPKTLPTADEDIQTETIPDEASEGITIPEDAVDQQDITKTININTDVEDPHNEQFMNSKSKFSSEDLLSLKSPSTYSVDSAKGSSLDNDLNWVSIETGDLFWGQIFSFNYWPCMVCPDPEGKTISFNEIRGPTGQTQHVMIHVRFFADNGRRSWVKRDNLLSFNGLDAFLKKKDEVEEKYGKKSQKYKVFAVAKSAKAWYQAVREADLIDTIAMEERLGKFFEVIEEVKVMNNLDRKRRQSAINSSTSDLCSMFDSNDNLYMKQPTLKRDRSPTPVSPAYSPLGPKNSEKRIKLDRHRDHNTSKSSFMDDLDMNPDAQPNAISASTEIERMQNEDIYNDIEFKKFASAMRSFILENSKDPSLNSEFMLNVRNMWALKHITVRNQLISQNRSNSMKRLSQRIRNISIQRSLPSTPVQNHEQQLAIKSSGPKVKKCIDRPIDEVIDDIFQLDSKYLFRDVSKEPLCKKCRKGGTDLVKCSMNCQTYLHSACGISCSNDVVPVPYPHHVTGDYEEEPLLAKAEPVICNECYTGEASKCFVCKKDDPELGSMARCKSQQCMKFYHPSCLKYWPQAKMTTSSGKLESLHCPAHVCHTCVSDDPKGKFLHIEKSKLTKCIRCPATYHMDSTCIPAGSQFLSANLIICPRHCKQQKELYLNVNWCFICVAGGNLICCETCPTSVHAECLKIPIADEGYICEECETGRMPLYGEMVWAKFRNYRWWPSIILPPTEVPLNIARKSHNPSDFVIRFFGSNDHAWICRKRVYLYQEGDCCEPPKGQKIGLDLDYVKGVEEAKRIADIIKEKKIRMRVNDKKQRVSPLPYVKIKVNRAVPPLKLQVDFEKISKCECDQFSKNPCGQDSGCLNRVLYNECNPKICPAGDRCQNQMFEKKLYPKLEVLYMNEKGFGLICLEPISAGTFVIEYVGEVIDDAEFRRRISQKEKERDENFYFLTLEKDYIIDAGPKGNLARFMNHSCEPNCETQKWSVNGLNRIGLFAIKDIPKNSELTFNYFWDELLGNEKKNCHCGAPKCAGLIGGKYKEPGKSSPSKAKLIKNRRMTNIKQQQKPPQKKKQKPKPKEVKKPAKLSPLKINSSTTSSIADTTAEEDKLLDTHTSTSLASLTPSSGPETIAATATASQQSGPKPDSIKESPTQGDYGDPSPSST